MKDNSTMNYEQEEFEHLDKTLVLIASENYPSQAVLDASGSIFQLPYTEGFPGKRYYQGCGVVDKMEQECIDTCLELFNAKDEYYASVQPNSGSSANMIVYNAILEPGDTVLAPDVKSLGHISHSSPKAFISKYHNVVTYGVNDEGFLDYEGILNLALEYRPKLIICGASNYSRTIDFEKFAEMRDKVKEEKIKIIEEAKAKQLSGLEKMLFDINDKDTDCYLMADIAHISILCAHGLHPTPVGLADFVTFTTHKCLASARSAAILYKKRYDKEIRLSQIPGLFGGALQHQVYAKLVGFKQALTPEFHEYSKQIIKNTQVMCSCFKHYNIPIVTGGSDNHLLTIDLRDFSISGKRMAVELEKHGVICNCNTVPNDPRSFLETSGIRLGTPAITTRGLKELDVEKLSLALGAFIDTWRNSDEETELKRLRGKELARAVKELTEKYPLSNIYRIPSCR